MTNTPPQPRAPKKDAEPSTALAAPKEENSEETPEISRFVLSSSMGLEVVGDPTFEEWEAIVATYGHIYDKSAWWIGDAISYGEAKFGEKYAQAIKITGRKLGTLKNIVSVCQRVQKSRRRDKLSFKHHSLIAGLHYQTGDELLAQAEREHWNTDDMEEEVKRRKALADGVDPSEPTRKPGTTAAKVAASGKEPQVPEGEKPLIWNGYPLRVMVMPDATRVILQGSESLPADEADKAAHFHKHAHGPALAAWLEEHNFIKGGDEPCATPPQSPASQSSAPVLNTSDTLPVASNGAAATEHAPTPQIETTLELKPPENGSPCVICSQPITSTDSYGVGVINEVGIMHRYHWECVRREAATVSPATPPASPEREKATETPLEACERHILAFNAASEAVDWTTLDKLTGKKWLERLLLRADFIIDQIQSNPPTPRK